MIESDRMVVQVTRELGTVRGHPGSLTICYRPARLPGQAVAPTVADPGTINLVQCDLPPKASNLLRIANLTMWTWAGMVYMVLVARHTHGSVSARRSSSERPAPGPCLRRGRGSGHPT